MNDQLQRTRLCEGVYFSSVTDPKFKHNRISTNLLVGLDADKVTENAIVPFLLRKGCKSCPDFTRLNQRLCELYGASLFCDVSKYGAYQSLELSIYGIDNRLTLGGDPMVADCAKLLAEVLLSPCLIDGLFAESDVELEKQQVIDAIESLINDKRAYALTRCKSLMCAGEPIAVGKYGEIDRARALTPQKAVDAYRRLLDGAQIEILFVGCGDPSPARRIFTDAFRSALRNPLSLPKVKTAPRAEKVREVTEQMEVIQGKLVLGMRTGKLETPEQQMAMRLMTAIYGGTPNSRLFVYVREKLSLCYYCTARFDRVTGLLFVDSGVEFANRTQAQKEILHQLELVQAGAFSDDELTAARLLMKNSLQSVTDSLGAIEDWYMHQILLGTAEPPAKEIERLEQVTREQVIAAACQVTLDTVYFLTGKEDA